MTKKRLYLLCGAALLGLLASCSPQGKFILSIEKNVYSAAAEKYPAEYDSRDNRILEWRRLNCGDCHSSDNDINNWKNHWSMSEQAKMRGNLYAGIPRTQPPHVFYLKPWQLWDKERNDIPY